MPENGHYGAMFAKDVNEPGLVHHANASSAPHELEKSGANPHSHPIHEKAARSELALGFSALGW